MHEQKVCTRSIHLLKTLGVFSLLTAGPLIFSTGCMSDIFNKYRTPSTPALSSTPAPGVKGDARASARRSPPPARSGISAVDQGTFRVLSPFDKVWDATLDVLLRNYNVAIADRANGLITTEWDSYYLDGKVHRNKVSLRLKRVAGVGTEMLVYNNVEVLSKMPDGGITEIWLPTDRNRPEVVRILQNMALALNLAKPDLSEELPLATNPAAPASESGTSL